MAVEIKEKIQKFADNYGRDVLVMFVVAIVAITSFGLGRLSIRERGIGSVKLINANLIEPSSGVANAEIPQLKRGGQVVASKNGKKYYLPFCKSALRIKEGNKIYFDSEESAQAAGYTPSQNCAGLSK